MFGFGFFPFFFLMPLILIVVIARSASGAFRSWRRHEIDEDYRESLGEYEPRRAGETPGARSKTPPEAAIFKLAYRLKGRLTVSDIVVETGLGVHESERLIESLVDNSRVRMEVDDRGIVIYEFPEIIRRFEE